MIHWTTCMLFCFLSGITGFFVAAVLNMASDKRIMKPKYCSNCGEGGCLHGHHDDYSKPLEVVWMCAICHKAFHIDLEKHSDSNKD